MSRPIIGYIVEAATKLFTSRKIGGVDFDGTKDINLPGVNQPGNQNTSGNAASATRLQTARKIGGVDFNGTEDITLPGVNAMGNQSTSGNAASATRLQTGRRINNTLFNGTADIITNLWGAGRNVKIGNTTRSVDGSEDIAWTLEDIGVGTVGRLNTNGSLTSFLRGDGTWAQVDVSDTTYSAGNGLTLTGTVFSLPVSVSGTGTFVKNVIQTANGIEIQLGTPPNTNTTYAEIPEAEVTAGTAATLRTISARRLKFAIDTHGLSLGTTASTAKAGNWLPSWDDVTGKPVVIAAGATQAAARQAIGAGTSDLVLGTAAGTAAAGNDSRLSNSREWTASTVTQAEAEAGTATTRRAWTAQRVRQAAIAAWNSITSAWGRGLVNSADAASGRTALGLGTAATKNVGVSDGNVMEVGSFGIGARSNSRTIPDNNLDSLHGQPTQIIYYGSSVENTPIGSAYGVVLNMGTTGGHTSQLAVGYRNQDGLHWRGGYQGLEGKEWLEVFTTGNFNPDSKANTSTQVIAGTGLSGGGSLAANRTLSVQYGTAAGTAAQGNDSRINNGQTAFGWGNHATAGYVKTDTKYTAGSGLTLSGTVFSLPVSVSGSGTFVTSVSQTAGGIAVTLGTPPNTNTTYAEITEAEVTAGTAATLRTISGRRLKLAVDTHGLKIGTTASTAKAGNWTPSAAEIPNLDAGKITSGVFAAARIPTLNQNTTGSAAKLTTARTLTIGSSGKTFDGSANVAWTLAEIGAADRARVITAGTGLSGGGNLTANRTISIGSGVTPLTAEALSDRDLNTVQTPGYYYQGANANATAARNYPLGDGGQAGTLVVTTAAGVVQEYTTYGPNNRKFTRGMYSSTWSEWKEVGAGGASSWDDLTGKPSTFPPSTHTHTKAQVGLGNVQNYGVASPAEASIGNANDVYMTPLRVKEAIVAQAVMLTGNQTISGTKDFSGVLRATGTANATSATSGSLRSSGGLGVASNIFAGGNITAYSDIRRKKDIVTIDGALDIILKARGVYYTRKDTGAKEVGFIAQEMQKILPRVVGGAEETGLGISYGNITAVLAEAVKTVYNDHVTPAKERISQLEDQNQKLIERLERLEALVSNKLLNEE